ncbi:amidohydrolase [Falsiroseomonas sp. E2-1-a20]|uniref:amidohydrolase n=1 Tax=Falsiroseomonas sp. E2-1-a20 TaxID=3239300 RepID=UPI003F2CE50B
MLSGCGQHVWTDVGNQTHGYLVIAKTLFGLPWMPHRAQPSRMSRIETDQETLPALPLSTAARAGALIRRCIAQGTGHIRTHVDITPAFKLSALEGVLAAREAHAHLASVQIVAFPQAGVMRAPGVAELLEDAVRAGADLMGGIDPSEVDRDARGQLDTIFGIAERQGVGIDIHLHEPGELGLHGVQEVCARTKAHGMQGMVTISHGFGLGGVAESKQKAAAELMASTGVALASHGAGGATLPPLFALAEAGVRVFCGNDDVRDTWSPYGNGDMLVRAAIIGWRLDVRHDPLLERLLAMCSSVGAGVLGIAGHGVAEGKDASFLTIPAETVGEAIGQHPPRRLVFFRGRLVARDGAIL